jgi:hypothetical protein
LPQKTLETAYRPCLDFVLEIDPVKGPSVVDLALYAWIDLWGGGDAPMNANTSRMEEQWASFFDEQRRRESLIPKYRVIGIMSDGSRDVIANKLPLERAEDLREYVIRHGQRDDAEVEPDNNSLDISQ